MSDKLTAIRIKQSDGTYSDQILISVLADNVKYDSTRGLKDKITEIEESIEQINIDSLAHYKRIPLYPAQFIVNSTLNSSGQYKSLNYSIASVNFIMSNLGDIKLYSSDSNLKIILYRNGSFINQDEEGQINIDTSSNFAIIIQTKDQTSIKTSDLNSVYLMTSQQVYNQYIKNNWIEIVESTYLHDYDLSEDPKVNRYGMVTSGEQAGFAIQGFAYYRIVLHPLYCKKPLKIFCPQVNTTTQINLWINGQIITIPKGAEYTIPKDTMFQIEVETNSTNTTGKITNGVKFLIVGELVPFYTTQILNNATVDRVDTSCLVGNKIFSVSSDSRMLYQVYDLNSGSYVVQNATLDHTPGHANTCNYYNGNMYVSDWANNQLIHVFSVDYDNNTLTYSKDIVLPETQYGCIGYSVRNNEKEIFYFGYDTGDATSGNYIVYGLYLLVDGEYIVGWEKKAMRCDQIIQGFTLVNNYVYYIECELNTYYTKAIHRLDLATGMVDTVLIPSGTILSYESESIIPISDIENAFLICDAQGRLYLHCFYI